MDHQLCISMHMPRLFNKFIVNTLVKIVRDPSHQHCPFKIVNIRVDDYAIYEPDYLHPMQKYLISSQTMKGDFPPICKVTGLRLRLSTNDSIIFVISVDIIKKTL